MVINGLWSKRDYYEYEDLLKEEKEEERLGSGQIIMSRPIAIRMSACASCLLGLMVDWEIWLIRRGKIDSDSSFPMRQQFVKDRIGLSFSKQRGAILKLASEGLIEFERAGIPARNYYKLNKTVITNYIKPGEV